MKTLMFLAVTAATLCAARSASAQARALPSPARVAPTVLREPCPNRQPGEYAHDDALKSLMDGGDCGGREYVDPEPRSPRQGPYTPCADGDCGGSSRRPDPCWYDDCPNGGPAKRWGIDRESLRGRDSGAKMESLNALFDNMSGKSSAPEAVDAGRVGSGDQGGRRLAPARAAERFAAARLDGGPVPFPSGAASAAAEKGSWGAVGAGLLAMVGLWLGRRKSSALVLASDEHTDPESRRNNPQGDDDVRRGWNENQARHKDEETVRNSSGTVTNGNNYTGGNDNLHLDRGGAAVVRRPPVGRPGLP